MTAELLHDDHASQRTRAEAAKIFSEWRGQQAKLGEGIPMLSAPAFFGCNDLAARVEVVLVAEQALNAVTQELLFICKLNIHLGLVRAGYRPSTAFAMMLRWISFDPP